MPWVARRGCALTLGFIYLPKCIKAYKLIMAGDAPQYGPFVVEEAVPAIPKARHYAA